jgi:hypothetical protein
MVMRSLPAPVLIRMPVTESVGKLRVTPFSTTTTDRPDDPSDTSIVSSLNPDVVTLSTPVARVVLRS